MKRPLFTGACTALVTPFIDGRVNYPMMEMLLKRQIDAGIQAVVVCGTTGEAPTLSDEEKLELFRRCKLYAKDRCLIIAGTGSNSTSHALEMSIAAQEEGADAVLVVSPYYNKATADGLYAHYLTIAHGLRIPMILYNVPSRTGVDIPVSVYRRLSVEPNIAGVKEASPDITKITRIRQTCPKEFAVWSGNDEQIVPVMSLGGQGVISVVSNLLPTQTDAIARAALAGDFDSASVLQCKLQPLIDALFSEVNPIPIKKAMHLIGYDCGPCRLPLTAMSAENTRKLQEALDNL